MGEILETDRLLIRRFTPADWPDLHDYLAKESVVKYEPYGVFTESESKAEAQRRATDPNFWAVWHKQAHKVIGNVYLAEQNNGTWELGYVFNSDFQGCGFATEAVSALVDTVFAANNARRIIAKCNPLNERSWRLLERLGFHRERHLVKNIYFKFDDDGNPIWSDTFEYVLLATEWNDLGMATEWESAARFPQLEFHK